MRQLKSVKSTKKTGDYPFPNGKKNILLALDNEQYKEFKIKCVRDEVRMTAVLRGFIDDFIKNESA